MKRLGLAVLALSALWANNSNLFVDVPMDRTTGLLAHRGVHQIYAGPDRTAETCTANPVHPMTHDFIANTERSIRAAFQAGADVVEVDVHLTTDGVFAVFHDWKLGCQTDGLGVTHEQSFDYLQTLDLGHGYTVDGVRFPLRGTAKGQMPSLEDLLALDLSGRLLINFKGNRAVEGRALDGLLRRTGSKGKVLGVYGGAPPTQTFLARNDDMIGFDRPTLKACLLRYALLGWSGYVPKACQTGLIAVPMDYAQYLWGWPHRFTTRLAKHGTQVVLWGPYDGSGFSSGIDDRETLSRVPLGFDGFVWTNRIELIGPLIAE